MTADIIVRYGVREEQLHELALRDRGQELQSHLQTRFVQLYTLVLRIQMRAVCQFCRGSLHRYARDVFQADDWSNLREAMKEQDVACQMLGDDLSASAQRREANRTRRQRVLEQLDHVDEAAYDYALEGYEARRSCQPGTRLELLESIKSWAADVSGVPIFWLRGMAGTGKTTIAKTMAERLAASNYPIASFFFRRNHRQLVSVRKLLSTIAYQLAHQEDDFWEALELSLERHPSLGKSTELYKQYQKLIIDPLEARCQDRPQTQMLFIVLDALDECEELDNLRSILDMLSNPKHHLPQLHVRIFITSREEPLIVRGFSHMPDVLKRELILQNVSQEQVDRDIQVFICARLREIRERRDLPPDWPATDQVQQIVAQANRLFIFAETVCRFVDVDSRLDPCTRLVKLCTGAASAPVAFSSLDQMYRLALTTSLKEIPVENVEEVASKQRMIVGCIVLLFDGLSLTGLEDLLSSAASPTPLRVKDVVAPLYSVLHIPTAPHLPVTILHQSFRDFLIDKNRCRGEPPLWVSEQETHRHLLDRCLEVMSKQLRDNICDLSSPGIEVLAIPHAAIFRAIPSALRYACRFWIHHAEQTELQLKDWRQIQDFTSQHLLQWLEAMSLLTETAEAVRQLDHLRIKCNVSRISPRT